jgi:hypothetical protein
MRKVLIIDTSILCVWLKVPGMNSCGHADDSWDRTRVHKKIQKEEKEKSTFVLPLATIIETGNHIAQASHSRKERADALADLMEKSADNKTPWAAFSDQTGLWSPEKLKMLAESWPALAAAKLSIGDATIKDVADYYAGIGYNVEILTGDQGLKSYEPKVSVEIPRRRMRR